MSRTETRSSIDDTLRLLQNQQRRYVLYYLLDKQWTCKESLVEQVAAWEYQKSISELSDEQLHRVEISLYHSHLPKLADHGLIEYDFRSGDITTLEQTDEIRSLLLSIRNVEESDPTSDRQEPPKP